MYPKEHNVASNLIVLVGFRSLSFHVRLKIKLLGKGPEATVCLTMLRDVHRSRGQAPLSASERYLNIVKSWPFMILNSDSGDLSASLMPFFWQTLRSYSSAKSKSSRT